MEDVKLTISGDLHWDHSGYNWTVGEINWAVIPGMLMKQDNWVRENGTYAKVSLTITLTKPVIDPVEEAE